MANKKPKITFGEAFNESLPYSSDVDSWATRLGVTAVLTALTNQRSDFYNEETLTLIYICLGLFALLSAIPVYKFVRTWWRSMVITNGALGNLPAGLFILAASAATLVLLFPTVGRYVTQQALGLGFGIVAFSFAFVLIGSTLFAAASQLANVLADKYANALAERNAKALAKENEDTKMDDEVIKPNV